MDFIQIKNIIEIFLLIYFIYYIPISMLLFMIFFTVTLKTPSTKDVFEVLNDLNKEVEKLRETNAIAADFLENFFETLINNKIAMLTFLMIVFLIPYFRIVLFISALKNYFDFKKKK